jgi:hypothetical protein
MWDFMKLQSHVYHETLWHYESEECLCNACLLRHRVLHLQHSLITSSHLLINNGTESTEEFSDSVSSDSAKSYHIIQHAIYLL